ncbi:MAG: polyphosphate kinase [marine bacterium B5-7]|nr:MAG: polyphosphate kinase [marine bacterium B5-7]
MADTESVVIDYEKYRVRAAQPVALADMLTSDTQGFKREAARKIHKRNLKLLAELQERLYAQSRQSLLVVLQAMDTGGKDSTIRKLCERLNPQGCHVASFKAPSDNELSHDFLWRVHQKVPSAGYIGIFNRSHYEDVLIVRVHDWASPETIESRYQRINEFEQLLADRGTRIVKIMLNISREYQLQRLRLRLIHPEKHWKFNPADLAEREHWDDYMQAYEIALNRCSNEQSPWYVIPAEKRWFRDAVVSQLVVNTLIDMNPQFPAPDFDPADYPPESLK